jgi:hypothetical protein
LPEIRKPPDAPSLAADRFSAPLIAVVVARRPARRRPNVRRRPDAQLIMIKSLRRSIL